MLHNLLRFFSIIFVLVVLLCPKDAMAQLNGTKNIPGDYATIQAAITDLNSQGVGSGGVIFNIAAGHTETTSDSLVLTATGTVANPILFQKNGAGLNPLITRTDVGTKSTSTLGGQGDAVLTIQGSDYVTFDGIDVATSDQGIEYGYYLRKVDGTNGCKFVTIKNAVIDLTKGTSAYVVGIYSSNNVPASSVSSATGVTVTSTEGRSESVVITGNTIQDVFAGIIVRGFAASTPFDFYDQNFVIGSTGAGNLIRNYAGNSASASYGIYMIYHNGISIGYNDINNIANGGSAFTSTGYGIFTSTATSASVNINNNTISVSSNANSNLVAISNAAGSTASSNTVSINFNTIQNVSHTTATTAVFNAIINSSTAETVNINNNSINNISLVNTSTCPIIETGSPVNANVNYNTITNVTRSGASGTTYAIKTTSPTNLVVDGNTIDGFNWTTITSTGSSYGFYGLSSSVNVSLLGNLVRNFSTPTTGTLVGLREFGVTGNKIIRNNQVYNFSTYSGGTGGATMVGYFFTVGNVEISSNFVYNLNSTGTTGGTAGTIYGIQISGGTLTSIFKNNIFNLSSNSTNPVVAGVLVSSGTTNNIYNNYISDLKTPAANAGNPLIGISITGGTTSNVFYNTVFLNGTSTGALFGSSALSASTTPTLDLRNNIFVNLSTPVGATGYTVAYRRSSTTLTTYSANSNNNSFYAGIPGTNNLIFFDGTNSDQTISSYKTRVSGRDASSFSENVPFVNSTTTPYDLHINTSVATQTESGGAPITTPIAISDDYEGNLRNALTPDVGADEFAGVPSDLSAPIISYTPLLNTSSTSSRTLVVSITDFSGVPNTAPGWPNLYWKINSASTYNAVVPTNVLGNEFTYDFGSGVVSGDTVKYFVVAQDNATVPNVGAFPSSGAGGFSINPPAVSTPPTNPSTYLVTQSGLAGSYTVGLTLFNKLAGRNITFNKVIENILVEVPIENPIINKNESEVLTARLNAGTQTKMIQVEQIRWIPFENGLEYKGDLYLKKNENPSVNYPEGTEGVYATITAAISDLNLRGVSGATSFLLVDTLYSTETLPIVVNITNSASTNSTNTVTIKPNTGVTSVVEGASSTSQVFRILNDYVTIDGSNSGGSTRNLTISNTSATSPQVVLIGSTGTTSRKFVTIKNLNLINGINTSSALIVSDGTTAGSPGYFKNISIQNNTIQKAYIGAFINAAVVSGNGSGTLLTQNDLTITGTNAIRYVGLYLQGLDSATVSLNRIGNFDGTSNEDDKGIWLATGTRNTIIERNSINALKYIGTGGYGANGLAISTGTIGANILIKNNMISDISGDGWSYTSILGDNPHGIYVYSTQSGINIYNNSIFLTGNTINKASAISTGICVGTGTTADVRNNIVINNLGLLSTTGFGSVGIFLQTAANQLAQSNYNNLFVNPTGTGAKNTGQIATTGSLTLSDWITASSKDSNSVSDSVSFVSPSDLHIPNGTVTVVESAGTPIASVTNDFDGQSRNATTPDIGADEFNGVNPANILAGDYFIPKGTNPQGFNTLADAISALNNYGVSGPVRFLIDGNLNETGANLVITRNDLTSTNNLIIKPAPSKTPVITITGCATASGANQYSGITYNGVSFINIDGSNTVGGTTRDLTIAMNDSLNGRIGITLYGNTDNIEIKNIYLKFNVINLINASTRGIYANGQASGVADSVVIENCQIADQTYAPAYSVSITGSSGSSLYASKIYIKKNELFGIMRSIYFFYGGAAGTTSEISDNSITPAYPPITGNVLWGILFNTYNGKFNIFNNKIQKLVSVTTATQGIYGIGTLTGGSGVEVNIYNNFLGGDFQHNGTGTPASIDVVSFQDNVALANVYHNTIVLNNMTKTASTRMTCVRWGGTANVNLRNNIIINEKDAPVAYALYSAGGTFSSNYNNLYVSGSTANIGYSVTALQTFQAWKDSTGQDANSFNVTAPFTSALDFHIPDNTLTPLESGGTPLAMVTKDIDGQLRNLSTPDIGADEFNGLPQIFAPSNLAAVADTFAVLLSWNDNSPNELGFIIERKNGDSLSVDPFVVIDSVGIGVVAYNDLGRTPNTTYTYRVRAYNQVGLSPYSNEVTTTTIIPVELTSFAANVNDSEVLITWVTASELNNRGFDLERKLDGEWQKLTFIEGKGTKLEETNYSFIDKFNYTSYQGTALYRLKQIDFDGTVSYSNVISVELDFTPKEYTLYQNYPNPFNPSTSIKFALPFESSVRIVIYNLLGEQVEILMEDVKEVGYHNISWNAGQLASGVYLYTIEAHSLDGVKSFSSVKKMMLIK